LQSRDVAVELRTSGTVEEHLRFLYDFENSLLLLRIKGFTLTAKSRAQSVDGRFSIVTLAAPRSPGPTALDRRADGEPN
jgi:hypothetical protein